MNKAAKASKPEQKLFSVTLQKYHDLIRPRCKCENGDKSQASPAAEITSPGASHKCLPAASATDREHSMRSQTCPSQSQSILESESQILQKHWEKHEASREYQVRNRLLAEHGYCHHSKFYKSTIIDLTILLSPRFLFKFTTVNFSQLLTHW